MNREVFCLLLALACSFSCTFEDRPWLAYSMSWTCLSPDGCERGEQVALIDRVAIIDTYDYCDFWSTQDPGYRWIAELLTSDSLPPECFRMSGFAVFGYELDSSLLCRTESGFTVELAIPNEGDEKQSIWRVDWQYMGRIAQVPQ